MESVMWRNSNIPHALQYAVDGTDTGCDLESSLPVFMEEREIRRTVIYNGRKNKLSTVEEQSKTVELSTDQFTPGLLKIFGGTIVPGVEYKSVLASYRSTAPELVKQALERYGLSPALHSDYVLCDVVGRSNIGVPNENSYDIKRSPKWQMVCSRVLADSDRPLLLQNFWRPAEGFSRRYELHKKSELSDTLGDDDTMGLNENARKISMSKLRPGAIPFFSHWNRFKKFTSELSLETELHVNKHRPPWDSEKSDQEKLINSLDLDIGNGCSRSLVVSSPRINYTQENLLAPMSRPFLLTLRGFDVSKDRVVHILDNKTSMICGINTVVNTSSIELYDPDIHSNHCQLHLKRSSSQPSSYDHNYCLEIECSSSSNVKVCGYPVMGRTTIHSGDIFSVGEHYIFLFKDFTAGHEIPRGSTWLSLVESQEGHLEKGIHNVAKRHQNIVHVPPLMLGSPADDNISITTVESVGGLEAQREKFRFAYSPQLEEDLVKAIGALIHQDHMDFSLSPSYLYCMCIQYACVRFDRHQIRNLLLRILMVVRENVSDITKALKDNKFNSGLVKTKRSHPDNENHLKNLIHWMSNGVQLILYLRGNNFRMNRSRAQKLNPENDLKTAFSELAAGLEEVVVFTFQQTIYTITKSLYVLLPAVLDGNPFSGDSSRGARINDMKKIISILDNVVSLATNLHLHSDVAKQMFMYLFFFCSTSVFNRLFLSDAGPIYYNWAAGVRIRANLGQIEDWAYHNHMEEEFGQLFEKLLTAAEFLSTSRTLLVKYDWAMLKKHFHPLNEAQLYRLLSGYFSEQQYIPHIWLPSPEDKQMAHQKDDVLLQLSGHPAFILPTDGCIIDLLHPPDAPNFWICFKHLYSLYGTSEEESDVGSSPSNTPRFYGTFPKAELQKSFFRQTARPKQGELSKKSSSRKVQFASVETDSSDLTSPRSEQITPRDDPSVRSVSSAAYDSDVSSIATDSSRKPNPPSKPKRSPRSVSVPSKLEAISSEIEISQSKEQAEKHLELLISKNTINSVKQSVNSSNIVASSNKIEKTYEPDAQLVSRHEINELKQTSNPQEVTDEVFPKDLLLSVNKQIMEARKQRNNRQPSPHLPNNIAANFAKEDCSNFICSPSRFSNNPVFSVTVSKGDKGLGLGLIDGLYTPLRLAGIYIRKILPESPAAHGGNLNVGDRLLCVNGKSIVGADYQSAMKLIKASGDSLTLMVAKGNTSIAAKIASTNC